MLDLTGSIRDGLSSREGTEGSRTCGIFLVAGLGEPDEAGGAEGEHLERVPDADRGDDVEPAGPALVNQSGVSGGDQEVWDGEEHREESVLHAGASADLADDDVAGAEALQGSVACGADSKSDAEHGGVLLSFSVGRAPVEDVPGVSSWSVNCLPFLGHRN